MLSLVNAVFNKLIVDLLAAGVAGALAVYAAAWFTPLSDWISLKSNRKKGKVISAALNGIGLKHMVQKDPSQVLTEADIQAMIEEKLSEVMEIEETE